MYLKSILTEEISIFPGTLSEINPLTSDAKKSDTKTKNRHAVFLLTDLGKYINKAKIVKISNNDTDPIILKENKGALNASKNIIKVSFFMEYEIYILTKS